MKIVKLASATFILLFLALRGICKLFSPSIPESGKIVCKIVSSVTKSSNCVFFFALNVIILMILLVNGKPCASEFDLYDCIPFPPLAFEVDAGEAKIDEDYNEEEDEFIPCLVHVEYKHEKVLLLEYFNEDDDDSDGFHGFDGYEEDNDDVAGNGSSDEDMSSGDEQDEDLKRRFDDFIAKNNKQWMEELCSDKLLLTAA